MKILAVIPARGGSKGIPRKNIKMLGSKPLIAYSIDVALESQLFDDIIVSTEDDEIAAVASEYGAKVPFLRRKELANDTAPTIDVLVDLLQNEMIARESYDAICLLQCTTPFRDLKEVSKAVEQFKNSNADSLVSVRKVPDHFNPHWTFERNIQGNLKIATGDKHLITRRQELPEAFYRDGSVYLTKVSVILEQKSLFGQSIAYVENKFELEVNLDTMKDWKVAENMLVQ
ncbi:acylneuraminate cytidylyltransferase family protein [Nonlabens ponticola]|uniref:Acylneuraminate cytidylyltransferase family protein n=1 Tax=Nonlabens ponticola TaxID=2496866 RepID=A0A3S9MZM4_9FLAO|nr:acylneuraminate cytidylyltransferase family protein [Nonlabens ponticola]AZQ44701.1 acylneuraminate cytidylyltransferase family protein [Nonlabens ponticola]